MTFYTQDWFSGNIGRFNKHLNGLKDKPDLKFLEIGSFEGRSTVWLLENILTDETSRITCIDTFEGSFEHQVLKLNLHNLYDVFMNNVAAHKHKVKPIKAKSSDGLLLPEVRNDKYDFIYVDGCHEAKEVLEDAIMCFQILKDGGIMIFDDYLWTCPGDNSPQMTPKIAVEAFMSCYAKHIDILEIDYQVVIRKKIRV